jgi:hypothetical protein
MIHRFPYNEQMTIISLATVLQCKSWISGLAIQLFLDRVASNDIIVLIFCYRRRDCVVKVMHSNRISIRIAYGRACANHAVAEGFLLLTGPVLLFLELSSSSSY